MEGRTGLDRLMGLAVIAKGKGTDALPTGVHREREISLRRKSPILTKEKAVRKMTARSGSEKNTGDPTMRKLVLAAALGASLLGVQLAIQAEGEDTVKVKIETTMGDIYADLYAKEVPKTVENFVTLAKKGFYDGIIFHRVIPDFMIQTGDPTGTGMGGPGYQFADEFSPNLIHDKAGVLSMANSGPNTNGSQFFIIEGPTPHLNNRHSVFGHVTQGVDIVKKIATAPRDGNDRPRQEIKMTKVTVL